jgi:hypothetical protein
MKSRTTRDFRESFTVCRFMLSNKRGTPAASFARIRTIRDCTKKIYNDSAMFSARVGISYPAVAALDGDTLVWFWIGSHAEYDKLLAQM